MVLMLKTKINGQWDIMLPEHRAARPEWKTEQGWEKARLDHMSKNLGKGDVIAYIGAEEGEMPALCQMWGAKVFLIEPNPKVWPNIKAIWEANYLDLPYGYFVGFASNITDRNPSQLNFEDGDRDGWPICSYDEVIGDHAFRQLNEQALFTPQIKIDDTISPITALSIDVEGSEWRVLEGAAETIKRDKPKIWLSGHPEFMFHQYDEYLSDLRGWIKAFGYTEELLDYDHECHLYYEGS